MTDRNVPALSAASLEVFTEPREDLERVIDETILDGEGVTDAYLEACRQAAGRLTGLNSIIDYHTFPRDRQGVTYLFFDGDNQEYRDEPNLVNNPMQLVRPKVLASPENMARYGIGTHMQGPSNHARSAGDRYYGDSELESSYVDGLSAYEKLCIGVMETVNTADREEALGQAEEHLADAFAKVPELGTAYHPYTAQRPSGWLVHASLSLLLSSHEGITPAGRMRALGLLQLYNTDELVKGLIGTNYQAMHYDSGLRSSGIRPRVPYTFTPPDQRHLDEHKDWERNPKVAAILAPLQSGDFRLAASNVVHRPTEAIQLGLLCLMGNPQAIAFGIEVLRTIPSLDRKTQALMIDPRYATFYVDNRISNTIQSQVAEGIGTQIDPTLLGGITEEVIDGASPEELRRLLGATLLRLRRAEELIGNLTVNTKASAESAAEDPDGYLAMLGLSSAILRQFADDDQLDLIINGAWRTMSRVTHPDTDHSEDSTRRQQRLNGARDALMDRTFRQRYGRR